jgi:hypothetical protein
MGMAAEDEDPDIYIGDIVTGEGLQEAIDGCDALVILTSGVPKLRKREIFKSVLFKLIGQQRLPKFYYDQMPEQVDWIGCKNQIDAAKAAGVQHIVLVSSMGVSPAKNTPDNILNKVRSFDIVIFHRRLYLVFHSSLQFFHFLLLRTALVALALCRAYQVLRGPFHTRIICKRAPPSHMACAPRSTHSCAAGRRQHSRLEGQGRGLPHAVGRALHNHPPRRPPQQARSS